MTSWYVPPSVHAWDRQVDEVSMMFGYPTSMIETSKSIYRGYRFPAEVIEQAVWLYFRFPLSLRMVEDLSAARGIIVSHETVRSWAEKFGRVCANKIRRRSPQMGDKWHLDEVVISINGKKHWSRLSRSRNWETDHFLRR